MRALLLGLVYVVTLQFSFAQKEGYNWYFGNKTGFTFHNAPPSALTNGQLNSNEGCCTYSTKEGRLLFYSDGNFVWDSNHNVMPNGSGLYGNVTTTQSCITFPFPGSKTRYVIVTVDQIYGTLGVHYSIIDMTLNNGNGDVDPNFKNIRLMNQNFACEKVTAILHRNERDFWIVFPKWTTDSVYSFLVTPAGVNTVPVVSNTGFVIYTSSLSSKVGYIKGSPDGSKIAYANYYADTCVVADFDNQTGKLSNPFIFEQKLAYGVEFSPNSELVYFSVPTDFKIYQYEAKSNNLNDFLVSKYTGSFTGFIYPYALQLGPDGKIYINCLNKNAVSVIHAPDSSGAACRLKVSGLPIVSSDSRLGLPNFPPHILRQYQILHSGKCNNEKFYFYIKAQYPQDSVQWDFGDSINSGSHNYASSRDSVVHSYNKGGVYTVKAKVFRGNNVYVRQTEINVVQTEKPFIGNDTLFCQSFNYLLKLRKSNLFDSIIWDNQTHHDTNRIHTSGIYSIRTIDLNGCSSADTVLIKNPIYDLKLTVNDSTQCFKDHQFVFNDTFSITGDTVSFFQYNMGDQTHYKKPDATHQYANPGNYRVVLNMQTGLGCKDSIEMPISVFSQPKSSFTIAEDTLCYPNNGFVFQALHPKLQYKWKFGDGDSSTSRNPVHIYKLYTSHASITLNVKDSNNCESADTSKVWQLQGKIRLTVDDSIKCHPYPKFNFRVFGVKSNFNIELYDGLTSAQNPLTVTFIRKGVFKIRAFATDSVDCPAADSLVVRVVGPVADIQNIDSIQCLNNNQFVFDAGANFQFNIWDFGNGDTFHNTYKLYQYTKPGKYKVKLTSVDTFLCEAQDSIDVLVLNSLEARLQYSLPPCSNFITLNDISVGQHTTKWFFGTYDSAYTKDLKMSLDQAGNYRFILQVSDSAGLCSDSAMLNILYRGALKTEALKVPNVFTPGVDQFNDCYQLGGLFADCGDSGSIKIFDRWGVEVFKGNLPDECWNGKQQNRGDDLPSGTYYTIIHLNYTDTNGVSRVMDISGTVHLIR